MPSSLDKTFKILATTANDTATSVLIRALDVADRVIQERAVRAVLSRRSLPAHRELLRRWRDFDEHTKSLMSEQSGRMSGAIREALFSNDRVLCASGCDAALRAREYDLMPTLINSAEDRGNAQAELAAETLLALADMLAGELSRERDYEQRFDPQLVCQYVLGALEQSVMRFDQHKRREIVEAFLLLIDFDNATLKGILQDPYDKCYMTTVDCLAHSPRPGVIRLLVSYLNDPGAPSSTLNVISRRKDFDFVSRTLHSVTANPSITIQNNLKKIESLRWLRDDLSLLSKFDENEQCAALATVLASGMKRVQAFEVVRHLLKWGGMAARRDAAKALADFKGAEANEALLLSLNDTDPQVIATLTVQLRDRGIPGAMSRLIELLDNPYEEVRAAARAGLSEFNFPRYLSAFDLLDDEVRRNTGSLVKKIDSDLIPALVRELRAPSRTRRARAIEAAVALSVVPEVAETIIHLLGETDQFVRVQAIRALANCNTQQVRKVLRRMLVDPIDVVRAEAELSLQVLLENGSADKPKVAVGPTSESDLLPEAYFQAKTLL